MGQGWRWCYGIRKGLHRTTQSFEPTGLEFIFFKLCCSPFEGLRFVIDLRKAHVSQASSEYHMVPMNFAHGGSKFVLLMM